MKYRRTYQPISIVILLALALSTYAQTAQDLVSKAYDTPDHQEAIALYDEAITLDPNMKYAFTGRGLRRRELGDIDGAISDFTRAIEIDPLYGDAYDWRAEVYQLKDDMAGYNNDIKAADDARKKGDHVLREYEEQLLKEPDDAKIYLSRAQYRKRKEDYKGAIEDFDKYLQLIEKPSNEMVFLWRANAKKSLGDIEGALLDYSTALQMFPGTETVYAKRAALRIENGDVEGANADMAEVKKIQTKNKLEQIEKITKAIDSSENSSYLLLQRSKLWLDVGNSTNALLDTRKVLDVEPNNPSAKRLEKEVLKELQTDPPKEQSN